MRRLLLGCVLLAGCGSAELPAPKAGTVQGTIEALPVDLPEAPVPPPPQNVATTTRPAIRSQAVQVTDTVPAQSPRDRVNSIQYAYATGEAQALEAFTIVAKDHGWSDAKIQTWLRFASEIMIGESGYCPNLLKGASVNQGTCVLNRQGSGEDAGIAQLTSVHYGRGMWLCVDHGICDKWTIISEPWISFNSFVWLLEREGSQPWCFSARMREYHKCWNAPDR